MVMFDEGVLLLALYNSRVFHAGESSPIIAEITACLREPSGYTALESI